MRTATIRTADVTSESPVVSTITMAFSTDPAARWLYADPHLYLSVFPSFVRAFGGKAFLHNTAHVVGPGAGAALWLPPEVRPDEDELMSLLERTVPDTIREDAFALFDQMERYHPHEPHWYLPMIGVDGPFQGRGFGSALLQHALAACDRDGLPAYLESSNSRNVPLYQRHGFELTGTIQAGSSPPVYPMLRRPLSLLET